MNTQTGWAAHYFDGTEYFDLGAGWESKQDAIAALEAEGADLERVEIYEATTDDGWQNWEAKP